MHKIFVKIESLERRKRSVGVIHIIAGFYLLANALSVSKHFNYQLLTGLPFVLVALVSLLYGFLRKRIDASGRRNSGIRFLQMISFLVLAIIVSKYGSAWTYFPFFAWQVVTLMLLYSERMLFREAALVLTKEGIQVPGVMKHHLLPWTELERVIVRADYVTLFRNDKKYVQLEVAKDITPAALDALNAYSAEQIATHSLQTSLP